MTMRLVIATGCAKWLKKLRADLQLAIVVAFKVRHHLLLRHNLKKILSIGFIAAAVIVIFFPVEHFETGSARASTSHFHRWLGAKPDPTLLKSGDLIFRHGRGFISQGLMQLNQREKKYSHAGIISVEGVNVFVYHAIGGEENQSNKLRKDPLEVFCSPSDAESFGVFRTDLADRQLQTIGAVARTFFERGLEFDTKFSLDSDDKMYCTEFVYKLFKSIHADSCFLSLSAVSGFNYVSC